MKFRRLALLVALLSSLWSFAATLRVPQDFSTVQAAVAASVTGDMILVSPGLYVIPATACTLANGTQSTCGLQLNDGTTLQGSGPAQTTFDFSSANIGVLVQNGAATVKLAHLQNAATALYAYLGSNITATNLIITNASVGTELNQGDSYTIINTTVDNQQIAGTFGIDLPFGGTANIQNNLITNSDWAFTAGSFDGQLYSYNDAFGSTSADWAICSPEGCSPVSAPGTNVSFDPLYCSDFSLQTGSPARNAGNPAILNPDGTRSDMGAFGGPEAIPSSLSCSTQCLPARPVPKQIILGFGATPSWSKGLPHNGIDYVSPLSNIIKSVGANGVVHQFTKPDARRFGSINPDGEGPAIWIKHTLQDTTPIYVLYGHTADTWIDNSTGIGKQFNFDATYTVDWIRGNTITSTTTIGKTAPFYNGGILSPHLHISIFKPKKACGKNNNEFCGPPSNGWGYSSLSLSTGDYIDPEVFFTNPQYCPAQ